MSMRMRSTIVAIVVVTAAVAGGCALPADGESDGGGSGGGGVDIKYCDQDHRGELNKSRCYDSPTGER